MLKAINKSSALTRRKINKFVNVAVGGVLLLNTVSNDNDALCLRDTVSEPLTQQLTI